VLSRVDSGFVVAIVVVILADAGIELSAGRRTYLDSLPIIGPSHRRKARGIASLRRSQQAQRRVKSLSVALLSFASSLILIPDACEIASSPSSFFATVSSVVGG
jgi:hypothetical protein